TADSATFPLSSVDLTVYASYQFDTEPASGSRDIVEMREGSNLGCRVAFTTNRYLVSSYNNVDLATFSVPQEQYSCEGYLNLSCDADADCPDNCGDGAPDSTILHWAGVGLREIVDTAGGTVQCLVYVNGILRLDSGIYEPPSQTPAAVTTFRVGAVSDEATTITMYIDDVVVCEAESCGWGYVGMLYPTSEGLPDDWVDSGCPNTTQHQCLDEYASATSNDGNIIYKDGASKHQRMDDFTADVGTLGENLVVALETVVIGRTATGGGTPISYYTLEVDGVPYSSEVVTLTVDTTERQVARKVADSPLTNQDTITGIQWIASTDSSSTKASRIDAVVVYAYVKKPDLPLVDAIDWGNKGTDTGEVTVLIIGDSTSRFTSGKTCPTGPNGGDTCSQTYYCSWDDDERDKSGGCTTSNHEPCRTCTGNRIGVNDSTGYACNLDDASSANWTYCGRICDSSSSEPVGTACEDDTDCTGGNCLPTTCTSSICDNNTAITCTDDSDCEGLGACDTTAICLESCPDSDCPNALVWVEVLLGQVKMDNLLNCSAGAATTDGHDTNFDTYLADGTPVSGTCEILLGSAKAPNLILVLISVNDAGSYPHSPNCLGIVGYAGSLTYGINSDEPCDPAAQEDCISDADCVSGVHASSKCVGRRTGPTTLAVMCHTGKAITTGGATGACTVHRRACDNDAGCTGTGSEDCTLDTLTLGQRGGCKCTQDDHCPAGYACDDNICHKLCSTCDGGTAAALPCFVASDCPSGSCTTKDKQCISGADAGDSCSVNSDCSSNVCDWICAFSGGCNTTGGINGCDGTCTKPSDDIACTDAADCTSTRNEMGVSFTVQGSCTASTCECTGNSTCNQEVTCLDQYHSGHGKPRLWHHRALNIFDDWEETVTSLSEGDGEPKIFFMTIPEPLNRECGPGYPDKQYILRTNNHLMNDMNCE
ncbi:MAG: hypothetical protein ACXABY_22220, partial [Candidatus Thorarchaeota archaeon]